MGNKEIYKGLLEEEGEVLEMKQVGSHTLVSESREERLEESINWIWTLPIPDEHKMNIEAEIRKRFKFNPDMFDDSEEVSLDEGIEV